MKNIFWHIYVTDEQGGEDGHMKFVKMQGLGNDFICVDNEVCVKDRKSEHAVRLCDRHYGIGADGLIFIGKSDKADKKIEIYNPDGTKAEMCGNGIRCVGRYLYEKEISPKKKIWIETDAGVKVISFKTEDMIEVDMGIPGLTGKGLRGCGRDEIEVDGEKIYFTAVSMGNPHAVIFVEDPDNIDLEKMGYAIEHHPMFPNRTNVEFAKVVDRENITMRVWERGAGETRACGTGACAAAVAAVVNGFADEKVRVGLKGGTLMIRWDRYVNRVWMTGPAVKVFEGEI